MLLGVLPGGQLRPFINCMLLMILLQSAAALNITQPAAALYSMQTAAAPNGMQPAAAPNGMQPAAAPNGMQPAAAPNGMQPAAAPNGMPSAAAPNGTQPAAALNGVRASPADITTLDDAPSTPYTEDRRFLKCCSKSAEESSRTLQRSHAGMDSFTHFPYRVNEHSHHQVGRYASPSTPSTLVTASQVIPFFISQQESPESASKEVAPGFSRVFTATSPSPRQENLADYSFQHHDNANKRMGKPLQFSDSLHEQGQSEFASTNQEKIRVPGFVPVTSIWNHHLQFVPENSQVPVESVNRSMALHFRGKPLNFVTEEKKNKTNISPIGGIGNPGLRGVPVSLGNFNSYRVPSENMTITSDSINGGGEVDVRQQYPFKVRGSFNTSSSNSQKFVSTKNQTRSQYPAVSHMPQSSSAFEGIKMWNYASDDVADASPSLQPPKTINQLPHVMQQSITADPNEQDYFSLLTSSPVPSDSLFPSTFGSRPLYSETQSSSPSPTPLSFPTDPSYSPIQLLQQYYQYFEDSDQSNFYEEEYPLNDSLTPEGSLENMPNYFGDAAYVPAFDSPQSPAETSASSPRVPLPPAPPSSDLVLSSAPTTSASGCLATTLCSLVVAAAIAIGATSAVAIPFLGRRRRNVDHIILSQDNAHEFVNYINYIKTGTLNNPGSENFFRALHDPADNSTRKIFRKLEQFIIRNKDKLLNISIQEIQLNEHIPIPKDILESINKINVESVNDPGKTDRGESEEDHTRTGDTAYSPGDMSPLLPDGIHASAMSSKLSDAKEELEDSNSQYGHDTEYNIILQHEEHSADVDARPFTGNYHTSYYNPFYGRPGSTVVGPNGRPYASNYLHPLQPVNTQRSQGTPVLRHPPRDRYPSRKPGYPYPPAHKHGSLDADIRLVAQGEGTGGHGGSPWRDRAGFYRTVCGALHHTHTPHNEITKFIASKCNILQNAGVI